MQLKKGDVIEGTRVVLTRGTYPGEEGTGLSWAPCDQPGDYSHETHGHLQGYREPIRIEILRDGLRLAMSVGDERLLYEPGIVQGLRVEEAIAEGWVRVLDGYVTATEEE